MKILGADGIMATEERKLRAFAHRKTRIAHLGSVWHQAGENIRHSLHSRSAAALPAAGRPALLVWTVLWCNAGSAVDAACGGERGGWRGGRLQHDGFARGGWGGQMRRMNGAESEAGPRVTVH